MLSTPFTYRPPIMGQTHMVSSGHYLAAAAGYRILELGGNAVDAGVASGIAINVTLPHATSFGGVAPIAIFLSSSNSVLTISGLGRWPQAASIDYFKMNCGNEIPKGILRSVVPSAPDAWLTALRLYGTMSFEEVATPALELAEQGFPISPYLQSAIEKAHLAQPLWKSTQTIFMPNKRIMKTGEVLVQLALANTFKRLIEVERHNQHRGRMEAIKAVRDFFYKGDIAKEIEAFSADEGGLITSEDLSRFTVKIEKPVIGRFREYSVYTCGAWSQGPVVAQTLQMLQNDDLESMGHNSPDYIHLLSQALNLAFSDRHYYYGDPDFVNVPVKGLMAEAYTKSRRSEIDMNQALSAMAPPGNPWNHQSNSWPVVLPPPPTPSLGIQEQDTSYTCVVDRWGNAFSATPSDGLFGCPVVPNLGFIISSRGSQTWLDSTHPSSLQPWKRPRLTPNPAIALKDEKLFMPFGTPGGDAQCPSMVQLFLNITVFGMDPQKAIESPRFTPWNYPNSFWPHAYFPGRLQLEGRYSRATIDELSRRGHDVRLAAEWSPEMGALSTIVVHPETGILIAGADPRRDTYAVGR